MSGTDSKITPQDDTGQPREERASSQPEEQQPPDNKASSEEEHSPSEQVRSSEEMQRAFDDPKTLPEKEQKTKKSSTTKTAILIAVCVVILGLSIWGLVAALGSNDTTASQQEHNDSGRASESDSNQTASTTGSATQNGSDPHNSAQQSAAQDAQTITVTLSIKCTEAVAAGSATAIAVSENGDMLHSTLHLDTGSTVYDALMASGLDIGYSFSASGAYISSIGGLKEKEAGGQSGWKYYVNDTEASTSSSNYVLSNGDSIEWRYTLSA